VFCGVGGVVVGEWECIDSGVSRPNQWKKILTPSMIACEQRKLADYEEEFLPEIVNQQTLPHTGFLVTRNELNEFAVKPNILLVIRLLMYIRGYCFNSSKILIKSWLCKALVCFICSVCGCC
jgi:hypothetical protein